jgi:hypothetical protein
MSNEFVCSFAAGATLYACIRASGSDAGKAWNETDDTWDNWADADLAKYKITMTENGTNGRCYVGSFPTSITTQGRYFVQVFDSATDEVIRDGWLDWTGAAEDFVPLRNPIR